MIHIDQHTDTRLGVKTVALILAFGGAAILAGIILGWGISKVSSGLKPASFYVLSNAASAVESWSKRFAPDETLSVAANTQSVDSGDPVTLTLTHANAKSEGGEYHLSYPCMSNFKLFREEKEKGDSKELSCGEKATLGDDGVTNVTLKPFLDGNGETRDIPLIVYFEREEREENSASDMLRAQTLIAVKSESGALLAFTSATSTKPQGGGTSVSASTGGSKTTVILPKKTTPSSQKPVQSGTPSTVKVASGVQPGARTEKTFVYYSTGPTTGDPNGTIDLEPHIFDIGVVDRNTNVFTSSSSPSVTSRIAVKFDVVNRGTKTSGSWSVNVALPTYPFYIYSGDSQLPLKPGEKIEFLIGFDSIEPKANAEVIVNVDPTGSVVESNESNNIIKTVIHPVFEI